MKIEKQLSKVAAAKFRQAGFAESEAQRALLIAQEKFNQARVHRQAIMEMICESEDIDFHQIPDDAQLLIREDDSLIITAPVPADVIQPTQNGHAKRDRIPRTKKA